MQSDTVGQIPKKIPEFFAPLPDFCLKVKVENYVFVFVLRVKTTWKVRENFCQLLKYAPVRDFVDS